MNLPQQQFQTRFILGMLIGLIFLYGLLFLKYAFTREFNFDEFQVVYASAAILRGKSIYGGGDAHFPLVNIITAAWIKPWGFVPDVLLWARFLIIIFIVVSVYSLYTIAKILEDSLAGLLAIALTLSVFIFYLKGIEIRHDVISMTFILVAMIFSVRYFKYASDNEGDSKEALWSLTSGHTMFHLGATVFFLALSAISTQKAVVWISGVVAGIFLAQWRTKGFSEALKILGLITFFFLLLFIIGIALYLFTSGESFSRFIKVAVVSQIKVHIFGDSRVISKFLYTKGQILSPLLYYNGIFFLLSLLGIGYGFVKGFRSQVSLFIPSATALFGVVFYLFMPRPFYQSLLPTLPVLGILGTCFLTPLIRRIISLRPVPSASAALGLLVFLFAWSGFHTGSVVLSTDKKEMDKQLQNVQFCLEHLAPEERVLCFTQQQLFYDPLFGLYGRTCGPGLKKDPDCFETYMKKARCRVIIDDRRTRLLPGEVRNKIEANYLQTTIGHIRIPGFVVPPGAKVIKDVWIEGSYASTSSRLIIDGKTESTQMMKLYPKTYEFLNPTDVNIIIVYQFQKKRTSEETHGL